jgi:hypothetical protein
MVTVLDKESWKRFDKPGLIHANKNAKMVSHAWWIGDVNRVPMKDWNSFSSLTVGV